MNDFFDLVIGVIGIILSGAFAFFLIACLWTAGPDRWACKDYSEASGMKTEFRFWYGCFVTLPDGTIMKRSDAEKVIVRKFQHRYQIEIDKGE